MDKIAIVTGGNSGLGFSISKELANSNINLCIIGRNEERLNKSYEEVVSINPNITVEKYMLDIMDESSVNKCFEELNEKYDIEYLFNVAGVGVFGDAKTATKEQIELVMSSNLMGLIMMSSAALKYMEVTGGKIINVMSTAGIKGKPKESIYCAAKWGARGYTEALKAEYKGSNIKVFGIYPGGMNTPFWDSEYSLPVNKEKFMNTDKVAKQIVTAILSGEGLYVSEMVIDRS